VVHILLIDLLWDLSTCRMRKTPSRPLLAFY